METITLEYDVCNEQAKETFDVILSSGLVTRKQFSLREIKIEKTEAPESRISALPFSAGLWADYDIDDRTLRSKAWGTHKRNFQ